MGNNSNKQLSKALEDEVIEIFNKIDIDHSKTIDKEETIRYWYISILTIGKAISVSSTQKHCSKQWILIRMAKSLLMNGSISGGQSIS